MIFDFTLYIIYRFLLMLPRSKANDLEFRCTSALFLIVFHISAFLLALTYMLLISYGALTYNKWVILTAIPIVGISIFIGVHQYYKKRFAFVIKEYADSDNYSKFTVVVIFLLIFFIPLLAIGVGLQYFKIHMIHYHPG